MSDSEIISRLQTEIATLRNASAAGEVELRASRKKLEALAIRSGELERAANLVATQATELCRQLRGGSMEHLRTEP